MIPARERRAAPRQTTPANRAWVQIMQWTGRRMVRARLINLSRDGALIRTEEPPRFAGKVWIRLAEAPEVGWLAAQAVRFEGSNEVGIRFGRRCPPAFLSQAILGVDPRGSVLGDEETVDLREMDSATWPGPEEN
jgi:hypothetical protein